LSHQKQKIMKTQITLRIVLVVVAMFISFNNTGNDIQSNIHALAYYSNASATNSSVSYPKEQTEHSPQKDNSNKEDHFLYIPQPNDDHDLEYFNFKHHEKRSFWRAVANKLFVVFYDLIVLSPIAIDVLNELLHHV